MSQGFTKELVFGPGIAGSGANSDITSMTGLTGALSAPTAIASNAGLPLLTFTYTASAVNSFTMINNATGANPILIASGADATVAMLLQSKGGVYIFQDQLSTTGAALRILNGAGTQYTGLKVADAAATTVTFTLPSADGTANAPLITNGSGVLSFLPGAWVSFSGTIGYTGFTGAVTTNWAKYKIIGKTIFVSIYASGTSNATDFTITGLPVAPVSSGQFIPTSFATNAGANTVCNGTITGTTLTLFNGTTSTAWTNSGGKGFGGNFSYDIA